MTDELVKIPCAFEIIALSSSECNKGHASAALTLKHNDEILKIQLLETVL